MIGINVYSGGSGNSKESSGLFGGGGIMGTGIGGIRHIKCSALLVINESSSSIMILAKNLHYVRRWLIHAYIHTYIHTYTHLERLIPISISTQGESYHIFGKSENDNHVSIAPMTAVVVFVCGSIPKTLEGLGFIHMSFFISIRMTS